MAEPAVLTPAARKNDRAAARPSRAIQQPLVSRPHVRLRLRLRRQLIMRELAGSRGQLRIAPCQRRMHRRGHRGIGLFYQDLM